MRKRLLHFCIPFWAGLSIQLAFAEIEKASIPSDPEYSKQTQECLQCHRLYQPGLVEDWLQSRHALTTLEAALAKPKLERRVSVEAAPEGLKNVAIGCYECHSQNPSAHKDNFEHFGFRINVLVTPADCQSCHPEEVKEYQGSKKAHAVGNLRDNAVYSGLVESVLCQKEIRDGRVVSGKASDSSKSQTCYACHGTKVEVRGLKKITTDLGEIEIPDLTNWPNQGVGRENPDGSLGSCTSCHPRHSFSIEVARKPHTCSECHLEPDVPAWEVYRESKHGNIYESLSQKWDWDHVPWRVGKDFKTPTCAVCHSSLITTADGDVQIARTHDFGARLWWRLFGLPYSHPQSKKGDTTGIRNREGLPLPASLTGEVASEHLIDSAEQERRQTALSQLCRSCHGQDWANLHFSKLKQTITETDQMTRSATDLLLEAQKKGLVDPSNLFDEPLEHKWIRQWMFYANSVRYGAAMGGPDYATFKNGWWYLSENLQQMRESIDLKEGLKQKAVTPKE